MKTGTWDDIRDKLDFKRAGKPALIGMAAILVLVAALSAHVLADAATAREFVIEPSSASSSQVAEQEPKLLYVHVTGAVESPGVYELEAGSRVLDAVEAAGGFAEDANTQSSNLARIVQDSEQIYIPSTEEQAGIQGGQAPQENTSSKVNINSATQSELESLPGIGASTAQKIIADRSSNGPFATVEDLTRVSGIGEKKLAGIIDLICV